MKHALQGLALAGVTGLAGLLGAPAWGQPSPPTPAAAASAPGALATPGASTTAVQPFGFAQAFDAAIGNDAQFRSARFERDSTQANVPIAKAALLPQVNLNASSAQTRGVREFPNSLNQLVSVQLDYGSPQASVQLRQTLFNWEQISRYRQALLQSDAADAVFRARASDLVDRLGAAYMQALLTGENLRQLRAQQQAQQAQVDRAEQRLLRGEGSRIEASDARAQLEGIQARLLDAQDQERVAQQALARITGVPATRLRELPAEFAVPALFPERLDDWLELARRSNPVVQVREKQAEVARMAIERSKAGHYPRLDAVATYSQSSNESVSNLNQSQRLASVGIQLSIPIFSGFGVEAGINQARLDVSKAEADLADARESANLEVQRQFLSVSSARARQEALGRAVAANELLLEGVTRGLGAGLRTQAEVQDAVARVFSARRELAQARLDYLLARLRLQLQSGLPLAEAVFDVERLLGGQP